MIDHIVQPRVASYVLDKSREGLKKVKGDEKEKWWSIVQGGKDSKERTKEKDPSKTRSNSMLYFYYHNNNLTTH